MVLHANQSKFNVLLLALIWALIYLAELRAICFNVIKQALVSKKGLIVFQNRALMFKLNLFNHTQKHFAYFSKLSSLPTHRTFKIINISALLSTLNWKASQINPKNLPHFVNTTLTH